MKSGFSGIHGVVAELITVPEGYETAIETALGNTLQNIVCEDDESAKRAIRSLKDNRAGRMTFLPIRSIKGREKPDEGLKREAGCKGFASECIEYDSRYEGIISYLLGRVVIADNMDSAVRLSKLEKDLLVVTMEGEIINARGAITGGKFKNKTANILDRRAEIAQLGKDIETGQKKQKEDTDKLEALRDEIRGFAEKIGVLDGEIRAGEHALIVKENEISIAENALEDIKNSAGKLERDLESIKAESENSAEMIEKIRAGIEEKKALIKEAEEACEAKTAEHDAKKGEFDRISEEITAARITVTTSNERKAHADDLVNRINETVAEVEADITLRQEQIKALEEERAELTEGSSASGGKIQEYEEKKQEADDFLQTVM